MLFGCALFSFILVEVVPGDPVTANLSDAALSDPAAVAAFRQRWGLDKPVYVQFLVYLRNLLSGDLGTSQQTGRPVLTDLADYVPATIEIAVPAMILALIIGVALGTWSAVRRGGPVDQSVRVVSLVGLSAPPFWLSIVALYIFFYKLGWFPGGGRLSPQYASPDRVTGMYVIDALLQGEPAAAWDAAMHAVLPILVLTAITTSLLVRFVRAAVLEVLGTEYVVAARAKGLPGWTILRRHVLRAALTQIVTITGLAFASLLAGTVLVEKVFSWPGLGLYAYDSATSLDRPAIIGVSLFVAVVYLVLNLLVDVLYGVIDPRIRAA